MKNRFILLMTALSLLPHTAFSAEPLGRLFYSAGERLAMDQARAGSGQALRPEARTLKVNGVVTRSSGRKTIWINGLAHHDETPGIGAAESGDEAATIRIASPHRPVAITRVGATTVLTTGSSVDLLGDGRISVGTTP